MQSAVAGILFCLTWYVQNVQYLSTISLVLSYSYILAILRFLGRSKQLDYPSGVLPVTHVDQELDQLPREFSHRGLNGVAKGAYRHYDAVKMNGLPVGVQVIGQRLQEEKVLAVMERTEGCLRKQGQAFELLKVD